VLHIRVKHNHSIRDLCKRSNVLLIQTGIERPTIRTGSITGLEGIDQSQPRLELVRESGSDGSRLAGTFRSVGGKQDVSEHKFISSDQSGQPAQYDFSMEESDYFVARL